MCFRPSIKVDAILEMPTPKNISTLKSFLASVQFYSKFLPPYFSEITEPLYKLTRKGQQWKWGEEEATSFKKIKRLLCTETVLAHYDPSLPLGLSCDASECGIGAVLFHRFADGSERPILNISKILSATQRRYSQIQKEALSLVYALKKFHQFLYGRKFIVVTDHKPLVTLFAPDKGTPAIAANRLARWALLVHRRRRHRLKGIHSRPDTNRTGAEGLSFYYPKLLHCLGQMLAVMLLSQHRVSSSKTVRPRAPCGARCTGHPSTWSAVCSEAPHSQFGEGARPHLCMDEWNRPTPVRTSRPTLVHQYDYTVEYRRSKDHGNADALSRLPFSNDTSFDGEEMEDDVDSVCLVRTISRQINPDNPLLVVRETAKDPILSQLMRFVKEGWHFRKSLKTSKSWKIRCQQRMVAFFTAYG